MRQLTEQHFFRTAGNARFGNHNTRGDGNNQSGDLRNKPVTDRQPHIGVSRFHKRHILLQNTDKNTRDDVDCRNDQARNGIPAHEFRRTVHRAVKAGFLR